MMVGELLNKLKWTGKLRDCEIIIRHRGAENDEKLIFGKNLTEVKKSYFLYKNDEETFIPMHRILSVKLKNKVLWEKQKNKS